MATHRVLEANAEMSKLQEQFLLFEKIEDTLHLYDFLATVALVTMIIQLLKNLHFHPKLGIISRTVENAFGDLLSFLILQGCIVALYAYLGLMLLGAVSDEFSSFTRATSTLLLVLTGQLPHLPPDTNSAIFLWSYTIIAFFIMHNALLAIIVPFLDSGYARVRQSSLLRGNR